jgi:hypothetical protein
MAILHCNTNGFYAFLYRLTSWRSYFTATLYLLVMCLLPVFEVSYFTGIAILLANVWTLEPQSYLRQDLLHHSYILATVACSCCRQKFVLICQPVWNGTTSWNELCSVIRLCFSWVVKRRDKMSKFWALNHEGIEWSTIVIIQWLPSFLL